MLDQERMPRHVAIIMDGNGRWAKNRGLPRLAGHNAGMKAMKKIVDHSRSEERRVGKECASMCRSRWSPYH